MTSLIAVSQDECAAPPTGSSVRMARLTPLLSGIWLFFLLEPIGEGWRNRDQLSGILGIVVTIVFAAVYMALWLRSRADRQKLMTQPGTRAAVLYIGSLVLLGALMTLLLGGYGLASTPYIGVACVMVFPFRVAGPAVLGLVAADLVLFAVNDWGSPTGLVFGVVAATFAVFGLRMVMTRNIELLRAQQENAGLAVENERTRFARDLHDILGHSLTVITVKAELAQRMLDVDPERTRAELADLERLSRDALADVRRAVAGYRELTLPGELARARNALAAAEIDAHLPQSADEVPTELRELFAWTVREGVTNVIRHSGAHRCEVRLTASSAEVVDDGPGPGAPGTGSGLAGLRERASAVGATVVTRHLSPGFSLQVVRG
ncbi:putative two-component systemsensor kinase [Nocardioides sp. PD653]|nr:Putative two-component system sensor kinase [Nocardioides sp. PD653-B2]GAW57229.1 putative two-component systemsensor kinase [Nocardioides sp. PD653]